MMKKSSIWLDNIKYKESEKLLNDSSFDVLIIGGGITGISIAYNLINSGLKVCLVEKNKIGHGVTSKTTGKITYLQELIYSNLKHTYDTKTAKLYLDSQMDAINIIKNIVDEWKRLTEERIDKLKRTVYS
jgi:glycine/D-amino acid oxidase-like deaminating enzyme